MVVLDEFVKGQFTDSKGSSAADKRGSCDLTLERKILEIQDAFLKDTENCYFFLHLIVNNNCDLSKTCKKDKPEMFSFF